MTGGNGGPNAGGDGAIDIGAGGGSHFRGRAGWSVVGAFAAFKNARPGGEIY
jgi:hypothetical protein